MRRFTVLVLVAVTVAGLPATAAAKGPSEAAISGPGLETPLRVDAQGDLGAPGQLGELAEHTGIFEGLWATAGGAPARTVDEPTGELGPRYTVVWTLPGPATETTVNQDLYPYAETGAMAHVARGQPFFDGQHTVGGWFAGGPELSALLLDLGLREPVPPPPARPRPRPPAALLAALVAIGCAAAWAAARARRRPAALPG